MLMFLKLLKLLTMQEEWAMFTNIILTIKDLFFTIYWIAYVFTSAIRAGAIQEILKSWIEMLMFWK